MNFLDVADFFIPGYVLLTAKQQDVFQNSKLGAKFVQSVEKCMTAVETIESENTFWSYFSSSFEQKKQQLHQKLKEDKENLINEIHDNEEYKNLINKITICVLISIYPDATFLSKKNQAILAQAEFSQKLQSTILLLDKEISEANNQLNHLDVWQKRIKGYQIQTEIEESLEQKRTAIKNWSETFLQKQDMTPLIIEINRNKAALHAKELALRLPLLNAPFHASIPLDSLYTLYLNESNQKELQIDLIDEKFITKLLFSYFQEACFTQNIVSALDKFNFEQANLLAKQILESLHKKENLRLDIWFSAYQNALAQEILKNLLLINGKQWVHKNEENSNSVYNSLSYLFWHSKAVNKVTEFFNKIADAHGFIQATGLATQNEGSFLAILDLYNYGRFAPQIAETKTILYGLFHPFLPLYEEYKEIALYEKNLYWKIFRAVVPMLIIAGFVVSVSAFLAPLAIPELAFLIVAIPAVFLGAALAAQYINYKNSFYRSLRQAYYGGPYEIPEFQINERMIEAFGNEEKANLVRNYYIEEIKLCDQKEARYQLGYEQGILSQDEIEARKENMTSRHSLCLEWFDIHSNAQLGIEQVPQIILQRLQKVVDTEFLELKKFLVENSNQVEMIAEHIVDDLKMNIVLNNISIEKDEEDQEFSDALETISEDDLSSEKNNKRTVNIQTTMNYSPRLFCLPPKVKAENAALMIEQITPNT